MSPSSGGRTVDEWLATHPDEKVGVAKPLNGILHARDCTQGNFGIQRIDHTRYESAGQSHAEQVTGGLT